MSAPGAGEPAEAAKWRAAWPTCSAAADAPPRRDDPRGGARDTCVGQRRHVGLHSHGTLDAPVEAGAKLADPADGAVSAPRLAAKGEPSKAGQVTSARPCRRGLAERAIAGVVAHESDPDSSVVPAGAALDGVDGYPRQRPVVFDRADRTRTAT